MISLIHPSRGRPFKAKQSYENWITKSSKKIDIEHILSVDLDDKKLFLYKRLFADLLINNSSNVVEATNSAAKKAKGNILIYMSDDFECPVNWDLLVLDKFKEDKPILLKVDDKLQPFNVDVVTIPIINRQLYNKLGYFLNPLYKSMYSDQDLYWVCFNNGWLELCPELIFRHNHWANRKSRKDETYIHTDSFSAEGKKIYEQRKSQNFTI